MTELNLSKTKLTYRNGILTKEGGSGATNATFDAKDIKSVRVEETAEYGFPLVIGAVFAGLATVSKLYVSSPGWSWTGTIICLGVVFFSMLMVKGRKIVVETKDGSVGFQVNDQFEEADGFVLSLRNALNDANQTASDNTQQVN